MPQSDRLPPIPSLNPPTGRELGTPWADTSVTPPVLNLLISKGPDVWSTLGAAGATGAQGIQGIQGIQGVQGIAGSDGAAGAAGTTLHSGLSDVTSDQHHAQLHQAAHHTGGADALTAANVGAAATSHAHVEGDVTSLTGDLAAKEATANKGAAAGYASLDAATKVPIAQVPTGQTGTTVPLGNDARFTDARTPTAHVHVEGDTTSLVADLAAKVGTSDARLTDARVPLTHDIITAHSGFPGGTATYLRADGTFAAVAASVLAEFHIPLVELGTEVPF